MLVVVLARDGDTAYPGADPVGSELGAESLPIGPIGPIGPMGRGRPVGAYAHPPPARRGNACHAVPYGRIFWGYLSRHFVPGYDHSVPTGRGCCPIPQM